MAPRIEQCEVVRNALLVFCEAMKSSGRRWPAIFEEVQERCLARIAGCVRFIEGLAPQLQMQAPSDAIGDHPWQQTLAYVYGRFKGHGPSASKAERKRMFMLAAPNRVECLA